MVVLSSAGCGSKRSGVDAELSSIDLLRGDIALCGDPEFGEIDFSLSCDAEVKKSFDLAISLLHSFEYDEAEKAFVKVIDQDPECVMAYWGVAMSNFHSLWLQSGTDYLEKGSKILALAEALPKSERERDYLEAIGSFYKDWKTTDRKSRLVGFEKKMGELYEKYRDDQEAAIFYALALNATADPGDKTYSNQKKAGLILQSIAQEQPNHPGISHYLIHNYDYPELAEMALPMARRYAQIAPASAHAQHMPSHIFIRLGLWDESIHSNINSVSSALCYSQNSNPDAHWDEELHGMDYLVYAYLQVGANSKANEQYEYLKTIKKVFPENFKIAYSAAAIPARIVLENRNWKDAAVLKLPDLLEIDWSKFPWQKAILHFTRAMGSLHLSDIPSAEKELALMDSLHQELLNSGNAYEADQVKIQMLEVAAWMALKKGDLEKAVTLMKEAVHREDNTAKHPVTPGEVLPAGELLGDLYLTINRPQEALEAYENDLTRHPNRFNGLYGAAMAARQTNDIERSTGYFAELLELTEAHDSDRPELKEAGKFLGKNN